MFNFKTWAPYFVVCLYACTLSTASALTASSSTVQSPTIGNCPVFPTDNVWNAPVDQLPLNSYSASWVGTIGSTAPLHPDFGSDPANGIPFITVSGTQTKYPVTFGYADESDPGPYATPLNAPIEGGSTSSGDRHAISIDTDNCILYEMWAAYPQAASWSAGSGAIYSLTSDALRTSGWTSADAAGLPVFPGLVRYDEVASGQINHALRFTVPHTQDTFLWPARHFASSLTGYQYPPMGARFRLRADFDISGFSPTNQVILTALKKYGMIIADNGTSWFISGAPDPRWDDTDLHALTTITGSNFEAVDESSLMVNVDSGQTTAGTATLTVSINPPSASVTAGNSVQFAATVTNATSQIVTWSVRDETLHCNSIIRLFRTFIQENPELWDEDLRRELYLSCATIVSHEDGFIDLAFEQGPIEGLTAREVKQYIRYIADRRLVQLGLNELFRVARNPLPWLDDMLNAVEHANFFENRATEYSKASTSGTWEEAFA